jgi:phosphoribosylanthranilate isomerase
MTDVKICGLSDEATLDAALSGGARYVGFIFFPKSPRYVALERAAVLAAKARGRAETVAVTVDADDELHSAITRTVAPDWVQLHGRESVGRVEQARRFAKRGVIRALQIGRSEDLADAAAFDRVADMLLFDAKAPEGADRPGGHGRAFDWQMLSGRKFTKPWLLSGGLDSDNVARAIRESGAAMVDVSSGVESAPGIKDRDRIAAFLRAASSPV